MCEKNKVEPKPTVYIFNKIDKVDEIPETILGLPNNNSVFISAKTGKGLEKLIETVENVISSLKKDVIISLPHAKAGLLDTLYKTCTVKNVEYTDEGITVVASVSEKVRGQMKEYIRS